MLKGDATVTFEDPFAAASAPSWFNGKTWSDGVSVLHVSLAEAKQDAGYGGGGYGGGGGGYGGGGGGYGGGGGGYGGGGGGYGACALRLLASPDSLASQPLLLPLAVGSAGAVRHRRGLPLPTPAAAASVLRSGLLSCQPGLPALPGPHTHPLMAAPAVPWCGAGGGGGGRGGGKPGGLHLCGVGGPPEGSGRACPERVLGPGASLGVGACPRRECVHE